MSAKSLLEELEQVQLAIDLIELGARLQVLETETDLSRARLIRLFKEVRGMSPPKGMLPFSTDWFITWMPNVHSSLFYNIYQRLLGTWAAGGWRPSSRPIGCIWSRWQSTTPRPCWG